MALPKIKNFEDYDQYITEPDYTTSAQAQEYFKNQRDLLGAVIVSYWQPETTYPNGYIVQSDSMPNGAEAVCVAVDGGKTGNVEPEWGEIGGSNISDGTCFWHLRHKVATVNGLEPDDKGNIQIPVMTGSNGNTVGKDGLVPAPPATEEEKFLSNTGEWKEAGKVKSVNGKTGDVVIPEPNYPVTSVNGKTGDVEITIPEAYTGEMSSKLEIMETITGNKTYTVTGLIPYKLVYLVYGSGEPRESWVKFIHGTNIILPPSITSSSAYYNTAGNGQYGVYSQSWVDVILLPTATSCTLTFGLRTSGGTMLSFKVFQ